jgi:rubrerythrin
VAKSLAVFGWQQPIVVNRDGLIIVGHTRYKAALSMGWTEGWVHVAENLTPEQEKAYRIADNKTGEFADWDMEKLAIDIASLDEAGADLGMLCFPDGEVERILAAAEEASPPEDFDEVDENISTDHKCPKCGYVWSGGE